MRENPEINGNVYLLHTIKEADDKKYLLTKTLYEMSALEYTKGSRKGDYEIRDHVRNLNNQINLYYEQVKLFDTAKHGDHRAFEDILVFFLNSFIDSCSVEERITSLRNAIRKQELEDLEHNRKHGNKGLIRKTNIFIEELKKQLKKLDTQFSAVLHPLLINFLDDVNGLLLYGKIKSLTSNNRFSLENVPGNKTSDLNNFIITFIWLHQKIHAAEFSHDSLTSFLQNILGKMGFTEQPSAESGPGHSRLDMVFKDVFENLAIKKSVHHPGKNRSDLHEISSTTAMQYEKTEIMARLKSFLDELLLVSTNMPAMYLPEYHDYRNLAKNKKGRYLFHSPGSFDITLKTVSDYHTNSLTMIFSWLRQDIKKNRSWIDYLRPFISILPEAERFVMAYSTAMYISADESNQGTSFFNGEIQQYIPRDLADELLRVIGSNCMHLDEAFSDAATNSALTTFSGQDVLIKKLGIVRKFYHDARSKILVRLEKMYAQ